LVKGATGNACLMQTQSSFRSCEVYLSFETAVESISE
jgi:hypothetical protein